MCECGAGARAGAGAGAGAGVRSAGLSSLLVTVASIFAHVPVVHEYLTTSTK